MTVFIYILLGIILGTIVGFIHAHINPLHNMFDDLNQMVNIVLGGGSGLFVGMIIGFIQRSKRLLWVYKIFIIVAILIFMITFLHKELIVMTIGFWHLISISMP